MPNIKFNYLYRDSDNYKNYGFVVFLNPENINLIELEELIKTKLIDGEWFYADQWRLPELFLDTFDFKIDPNWHEFESVELTTDSCTSSMSLVEFITIILSPR